MRSRLQRMRVASCVHVVVTIKHTLDVYCVRVILRTSCVSVPCTCTVRVHGSPFFFSPFGGKKGEKHHSLFGRPIGSDITTAPRLEFVLRSIVLSQLLHIVCGGLLVHESPVDCINSCTSVITKLKVTKRRVFCNRENRSINERKGPMV
jgi:hypothetical protein